jgi:hypothetical protein
MKKLLSFLTFMQLTLLGGAHAFDILTITGEDDQHEARTRFLARDKELQDEWKSEKEAGVARDIIRLEMGALLLVFKVKLGYGPKGKTLEDAVYNYTKVVESREKVKRNPEAYKIDIKPVVNK